MTPHQKALKSALEFRVRLKAARKNVGLTQEELVAIAECSAVTLSKLETGVNRPTYEILVSLAYALDVSPNALIGWDSDPPSQTEAAKKEQLTRLMLLAEHLSDEWIEQLVSIAEKASR
ncbi:helix-turn-helix domain-containing protein [Chelatococcus asaccharovorans]|uniref:Transcriptional regulator with XRE-family HTH domain n=1 Tax=Chelatococcus asaccharovorans TaxID=28210 RepID=A0A2V3TSD0_9HYPH|nr:helix-turn-helix transcriptional regulator [Chelatococcus asaccharovorans]MBS7708024.1 helix-turn-helix transcriptional regulator [Chelatococcus asaccharovorans]PXW50952.1 transcriptional regulator with XRE-family HTH domain [Chelatococcus asaccharovorans]